ncbi:MAG TPA: LCP family protein [Marmoricola sp.]|nr:LCP family protein [Marmoricola sp.]
MPDRPQEPPEYDWLYGKNRAAAGDDADHTRVLPTMDRPETGRRASSGPPPRRVAPTPGGERPRRRHRIGPLRLVLLIALLYVVYLVAVPFWAWQKMDTVAADPSGDRPAEQPGTTYLVVGSDSRKGLTAAEKKKLGTGGVGDIGQRTDTIMLLHTGDGPSLLMSIPRDSIVPIPGHSTTKINAAFAYGGAPLLVKTIEQNTGVRIDHYVEIGFGGFVNAVDAVGGVTICPKDAMKDPRANLDIRAGCQEVDGITALGYARSRHAAEAGDIGRAAHQREVVSAIGDKVKSPWTILNPVRYFQLNMAMTESLRVGKDTGPLDMARMALAMTQVNGKDGLTCGMPIADLAVHWDRERALALLRFIKEDRTADIPAKLCTPNGLPG